MKFDSKGVVLVGGHVLSFAWVVFELAALLFGSLGVGSPFQCSCCCDKCQFCGGGNGHTVVFYR